MSVTLEYAYNKKLGLPGFSSHGASAMGSGILGDPYLVLDDGVQCSFDKGSATDLSQLSKGQFVTVIGTHRGKLFHVQADNCRLLSN